MQVLNTLFSKRSLLPLLLLLALFGCASTPKGGIGAAEERKAREALALFRQEERLAPFFEAAPLVAVYPATVRAGVGFGAAYGQGLVFRGDEVIGRTRVYQFSAGVNFGGEMYRQILFFRSEAAFERLFSGAMEFAGQANLAVATAGSAATPSFNQEVALFTQVQGGLLLEATVGAHHYRFTPLESTGAHTKGEH
jgi:lipid-binding SYLF domain-containing protein